jgi:hypothetical protein
MERAMGRPREIASVLEGLAEVAVSRTHAAQAVRLSTTSVGIRASVGAPLSAYGQAAVDRTLEAARTALDADAFDAAWAAAQAVLWEQVVDEILADWRGRAVPSGITAGEGLEGGGGRPDRPLRCKPGPRWRSAHPGQLRSLATPAWDLASESNSPTEGLRVVRTPPRCPWAKAVAA